jgi:hypothetical protein
LPGAIASARRQALRMPEPARKRGVSLGLVGCSFFFCPPVGLILAWRHPAYKEGGRRDPLLVLATLVYLAILAGSIVVAFLEE